MAAGPVELGYQLVAQVEPGQAGPGQEPEVGGLGEPCPGQQSLQSRLDMCGP